VHNIVDPGNKECEGEGVKKSNTHKYKFFFLIDDGIQFSESSLLSYHQTWHLLSGYIGVPAGQLK
jgi:hypothetical protein